MQWLALASVDSGFYYSLKTESRGKGDLNHIFLKII